MNRYLVTLVTEVGALVQFCMIGKDMPALYQHILNMPIYTIEWIGQHPSHDFIGEVWADA